MQGRDDTVVERVIRRKPKGAAQRWPCATSHLTPTKGKNKKWTKMREKEKRALSSECVANDDSYRHSRVFAAISLFI